MSKELVRNLVVALTLLVIAIFGLLCVESKGALIESRVGFIGLVVIAALLFLSVYVTPKKSNDQSNNKNNESNQS